jgi:HK97 family phage major capsid protein
MALTIIESAKMDTSLNAMQRAIIELYAGSSDILMNLPIMSILGNSYSFNREAALPSVAFRGVNGVYTASNGVLDPRSEHLKIFGGDITVDNFILQTEGIDRASAQIQMMTRAMGLSYTKNFLKGDSVSNPKVFDGLQVRTVGNQVISAGSTANGAALSLEKLNQAIDQTFNPTHLIMNKDMRRKFIAAINNNTIGGYITQEKNEFGMPVTMYAGLPILTVDLDETSTSILPFTEAAASGTATATSIYVVSMGDMGLMGLQNGGIRVKNLQEISITTAQTTNIEWYTTIAVLHERAVTRLQHIGNLAIVA